MIAWTSRIACAGFALPLATARASMVNRCGWYQALPSTPLTHVRRAFRVPLDRVIPGPLPAARVAAVREPTRGTCAATSDAGEVSASTA